VPKVVAAQKAAWPAGIGEVVMSRAFLFLFFSSFNAPRGLTLNAPKTCFGGKFVPCRPFFPRG